MARTMNVDQTDIYRMLVTRRGEDGRQRQTAYGPHDMSNMARDWETKGYVGSLPARQEKQQLMAWIRFDEHDSPYSVLEWTTIRTTYTNGGEGVEWDD